MTNYHRGRSGCNLKASVCTTSPLARYIHRRGNLTPSDQKFTYLTRLSHPQQNVTRRGRRPTKVMSHHQLSKIRIPWKWTRRRLDQSCRQYLRNQLDHRNTALRNKRGKARKGKKRKRKGRRSTKTEKLLRLEIYFMVMPCGGRAFVMR